MLAALAHADDAAAAHMDAGIANMAQGLQAVLVAAGGDDLAVIVGRGVEVVVVVVEAGGAQAHALLARQHAQRDAGLQPQRLDLAHHLAHRVEVAVLGAAPGGAHAEAPRPAVAGGARRRRDRFDIHQPGGLDASVVARRLRAIGAVFRTAAGLDRQQGADLHAVGGMVAAMHRMGAVEQIVERLGVEREGFGAGPVVPRFMRRARVAGVVALARSGHDRGSGCSRRGAPLIQRVDRMSRPPRHIAPSMDGCQAAPTAGRRPV